MGEHPIEGLMITAMNSIQDMVDVNTIIGEPIQASNNIIIIPVSKVCFGFAAGGSEFKGETIDEYRKKDKEEQVQYRLPFGGGSGAGVNINPIAFLIIQGNNVKLLPVEHSSAIDKLIDYVPDLLEKANSLLNKEMQNKKEEKKEERKLEKELQKSINKTKPKRARTQEDISINEFEYDETMPNDEDLPKYMEYDD